MAQNNWFTPVEFMFYDALYYYDIHDWAIEPMSDNVNTHRRALTEGKKGGWLFRTHNAKASYKCHKCGKQWKSSYTTIIWRAHWETGTVQITIEKQGCQTCNKKCQVSYIDNNEMEFALDWMCMWMLETFYGIKNENTRENDDEPGEIEEPTAPHDCERCEAGRKGTCRKCNRIKQGLK